MNVDNMTATLRRFYYSKIGRGNPMIFSFDYIKTTFENNGAKSEWQIVGEMVDKFKKTIQKEILSDGGPGYPNDYFLYKATVKVLLIIAKRKTLLMTKVSSLYQIASHNFVLICLF